MRLPHCLALLLPLAVHAAGPSPSPCPVPGEPVQWVADLCMRRLSTDDEIAASECIARELQSAPADACAAKRHFKGLWCMEQPENAAPQAVEDCIADPRAMGSSVRDGGVGRRDN